MPTQPTDPLAEHVSEALTARAITRRAERRDRRLIITTGILLCVQALAWWYFDWPW